MTDPHTEGTAAPTVPTEQPEHLDLRSHDIATEKQQELLRLFPEIRTEGGRIDFDRLKRVLGESVDPGKERYGMNWPGKADCFKAIQSPSAATLLPCNEESVEFDSTENLIIEGDNLEVLKLLQKAYLGKIKMIYIDPPYNTGNDFIYPDNYSENLQTYLEYTGQADSEGRKFSTNTEADGRFHSKWLNMMYPRLYLARNLLSDDGSIFVSIGEEELIGLRRICDEIFGEENFVATFVWEGARKNDSKKVSVGHDYVISYCRNASAEPFRRDDTLWKERKEGIDEIYKIYSKSAAKNSNNWEAVSRDLQEWFSELPETNPAKAHSHYHFADSKGVYFASDLSGPDDGRKSRPRYEVLHPKSRRPVTIPTRGWRWEEPRMREEIAADRVHFGADETAIPNGKVYLKENEWQAPSSVFYKDRRAASNALRALMGAKVFDFPKDATVLARFVQLICREGDIVLDFFAGSGSTAESVLNVCHSLKQHIKFILIQLPEPCDPESGAGAAGFRNIAAITKERVRRVIKSLNNDDAGKLDLKSGEKQDRGFKAFRLAESNFKPWLAALASDVSTLERQLELHVSHILQGRKDEDILSELLLKSGFPLTTSIEKKALAGKTVYAIAGGVLVVCLQRAVTLDLIRAIAEMKSERVVCLDESFAGNDQLKTNAVQIMKSKGVTSFRTV